MGEGKGGSGKCFEWGRGQSSPLQHTLIGEAINRGRGGEGGACFGYLTKKSNGGGLTKNPKLLSYLGVKGVQSLKYYLFLYFTDTIICKASSYSSIKPILFYIMLLAGNLEF